MQKCKQLYEGKDVYKRQSIEAAMSMIAGTARSMGVTVEG